jgi:hypothetical protein
VSRAFPHIRLYLSRTSRCFPLVRLEAIGACGTDSAGAGQPALAGRGDLLPAGPGRVG